MQQDLFIGWPLDKAVVEAAQRGFVVQAVIQTVAPKQTAESGSFYIIQERWLDKVTVSFVTGIRVPGKEVQ
jgi:hypothetical protein